MNKQNLNHKLLFLVIRIINKASEGMFKKEKYYVYKKQKINSYTHNI